MNIGKITTSITAITETRSGCRAIKKNRQPWKKRKKNTNGQTDRHTDRQTDRQTVEWADRFTKKRVCWSFERIKNKRKDGQSHDCQRDQWVAE